MECNHIRTQWWRTWSTNNRSGRMELEKCHWRKIHNSMDGGTRWTQARCDVGCRIVDPNTLESWRTHLSLETVINGKWKRNQFLPFTAMGLYFIISSLSAAAADSTAFFSIQVVSPAAACCSCNRRGGPFIARAYSAHSQCLLSLRVRRRLRFAFHSDPSQRVIHCVWAFLSRVVCASLTAISDKISRKLMSSFHCAIINVSSCMKRRPRHWFRWVWTVTTAELSYSKVNEFGYTCFESMERRRLWWRRRKQKITRKLHKIIQFKWIEILWE